MERVRLFKINKEDGKCIKGLAITFVLFGHMQYIIWGGSGGVALFLLLSGYGLNESYKDHGLKHYWYNRLKRVYFPYVLVAIFNILVYGYAEKKQLLITLIGLDVSSNIDATMWYISFLFYWYTVFYVSTQIRMALKANNIVDLLVLLALLGASMLGCKALTTIGTWHRNSGAELYIVFFPLGVVLSEFSEIRVEKNIRRVLMFTSLCLSTMYVLRRYIYFWTPISALAMAVQCITVIELGFLPSQILRVLSWLGEYSYEIFLFEGMLLGKRAEWFSSFHGDLPNVLVIVLAVFLSYLLKSVCKDFNLLIEKHIMKERMSSATICRKKTSRENGTGNYTRE